MALPVTTKTFTGANGTALATHDASWTVAVGSMEINTNAIIGTAAGFSVARWTADAFGSDHYAQATIVGAAGAGYVGPGVRLQANGDGYVFLWSPGDATCYLARLSSNGTVENDIDTAAAPAAGSVIKIQATGTTINVLDDGVEILSAVDATHATGAAGIMAFSNVTTVRIDDFSADNIGAAAAATEMPWLYRIRQHLSKRWSGYRRAS